MFSKKPENPAAEYDPQYLDRKYAANILTTLRDKANITFPWLIRYPTSCDPNILIVSTPDKEVVFKRINGEFTEIDLANMTTETITVKTGSVFNKSQKTLEYQDFSNCNAKNHAVTLEAYISPLDGNKKITVSGVMAEYGNPKNREPGKPFFNAEYKEALKETREKMSLIANHLATAEKKKKEDEKQARKQTEEALRKKEEESKNQDKLEKKASDDLKKVAPIKDKQDAVLRRQGKAVKAVAKKEVAAEKLNALNVSDDDVVDVPQGTQSIALSKNKNDASNTLRSSSTSKEDTNYTTRAAPSVPSVEYYELHRTNSGQQLYIGSNGCFFQDMKPGDTRPLNEKTIQQIINSERLQNIVSSINTTLGTQYEIHNNALSTNDNRPVNIPGLLAALNKPRIYDSVDDLLSSSNLTHSAIGDAQAADNASRTMDIIDPLLVSGDGNDNTVQLNTNTLAAHNRTQITSAASVQLNPDGAGVASNAPAGGRGTAASLGKSGIGAGFFQTGTAALQPLQRTLQQSISDTISKIDKIIEYNDKIMPRTTDIVTNNIAWGHLKLAFQELEYRASARVAIIAAVSLNPQGPTQEIIKKGFELHIRAAHEGTKNGQNVMIPLPDQLKNLVITLNNERDAAQQPKQIIRRNKS